MSDQVETNMSWVPVCISIFLGRLIDSSRKKSQIVFKPLWKHIIEKHEGRMEINIFEHFEMIQTGIFFKPQRRKANEGVRISHLDPETRMNSRDEFRQGTNIMMRAMRGVGV